MRAESTQRVALSVGVSIEHLGHETTLAASMAQAQILLNNLMSQRDCVRVLEAGCGSCSRFAFSSRAHIVGIDISKEQLDRNQLLHEKLLGDIQTFPLEETSFDVILCWDVLEHLEHPDLALRNFSRSLRHGGIMILGARLRSSLKGAITRRTPHWFYVFVYRWFLGFANAGKPGYVPFETFLKASMSVGSISRFAGQSQLTVEVYSVHEGPMQMLLRKKSRVVDLTFKVLAPIVRTSSRVEPSIPRLATSSSP
jgi:SAM-dependent methyltransferase